MKEKRIFLFIISVLALALQSPTAQGKPLYEFYKGVRAMGMGNAFTSIADDADAVFYNPAGLALNRHYDFELINPKLDFSGDNLKLVSEVREAIKKLDGSTIEALFGKNLYGNATIFPSLRFPNFTIGYYYSVEGHIHSRNVSLPMIDATYLKDSGFVMGFGHETRGISKRHFLRAGLTLKWLTREGFDTRIPLSQLLVASKSVISSLNKGPASGYGATIGLQYEIPLGRGDEIILGTSWQDIGDMRFGSRVEKDLPPSIRNNLASGFAWFHRFGAGNHSRLNLKLSGELRHIVEGNVDPRLKIHMGSELQMGAFSIQAGINQSSLTGGASFDWWFMRASAVTYGIDNQALAYMERERRYMFQLTFKLDFMGDASPGGRDEFRRKYPRTF